jgi:hypothetical protein
MALARGLSSSACLCGCASVCSKLELPCPPTPATIQRHNCTRSAFLKIISSERSVYQYTLQRYIFRYWHVEKKNTGEIWPLW